VQLLAAAAICLLAFMNCCDIKLINKFIKTFMFLKLTAVALVIVGGGFALYQSNPKSNSILSLKKKCVKCEFYLTRRNVKL
jgi:amino acid transporter